MSIYGIRHKITLSEYQGYIFEVAVPPYLDVYKIKKQCDYRPINTVILVYQYAYQTGDTQFVYEFRGARVK